jgi:hypothetical protein
MLRAGRMGGVTSTDRVCAFAIAIALCCILVPLCVCVYIYMEYYSIHDLAPNHSPAPSPVFFCLLVFLRRSSHVLLQFPLESNPFPTTGLPPPMLPSVLRLLFRHHHRRTRLPISIANRRRSEPAALVSIRILTPGSRLRRQRSPIWPPAAAAALATASPSLDLQR